MASVFCCVAGSAYDKGTDVETPSAAETRVVSGEAVGDPSGVNPSLTPSNAQIAEARSLAGGKVGRALPVRIRTITFSLQVHSLSWRALSGSKNRSNC